MNRLAACAVVGSCLLLPACATTHPWVQPPQVDPNCRVVPPGEVTLEVDEEAQVECIQIEPGRTNVFWKGKTDNVKYLLIAFKRDDLNPPPEDPTYSTSPGNRKKPSKLNKRDVMNKQYSILYSVIVVRKDGSVRSVDPRLIIKP